MEKDSTRRFSRALRKHMTKAEVILWTQLRRDRVDGLRFRRQFPIGSYFADFACPAIRLVVEVDGSSHWSDEAQQHDARRRAFLARTGWHEIRVCNDDVLRDLDRVVRYIASTAAALPRLQPAFALRATAGAATPSLREGDKA